MLQTIWENLIWVIGGDSVDPVIPVWQLVIRTIVIYAVAIIIIRVGKRRFMGGFTTFDILLGFIVGSVMSRAITGTIRLIDMLLIVGVLVAIHWMIAVIGYYASDRLSKAVKNTSRKLVEDGKIIEEAMRRSKIGEHDLMQAVRSKGNVESIENVKAAYLERDGNITVIPHDCAAHVVDVEIDGDVKIVKIKIEHS